MKTRHPSLLENLLTQDPGQNNILARVGITDYASLAKTSYSMSEFFKPRLEVIGSMKLLYYIVQKPNDEKVKFILRSNINFLNVVYQGVKVSLEEGIGKTQIYSDVTPLQLAYGAKDDVMCNTLKPFFIGLYRSEKAGIAEMERQISELKTIHTAFDFTSVIKAIANESFDKGLDGATNKLLLSSATLAAIENFRTAFHASQPKIINKSMHFRWETIHELLTAYYVAAKEWNYEENKCALLEDAVLSWVLRYVPENAAQYFNQGLAYLQDKKNPEPFKRADKTRDGHHFYASLKQQSAKFLLEGSCVDIIRGCQKQQNWPWLAILGDGALKTLISHQNFELAKLIERKIEFAKCCVTC